MKKTIFAVAVFLSFIPFIASGATILFPTGGGTGSSTLSGIILGNGTAPVRTLTIGTGLTFTGTTLGFTSNNISQFTNNSGYLTSAITVLGDNFHTGLSGATQTFATSSDTNIGLTIVSSGSQHLFTPTWTGTLADGRIASAATWNAKQASLGTPTPGFIASYQNGSWTGVATTTFNSPLTYAAGAVSCASCLTANQSITLSGDVSGVGSTAITTAIGANKVTLGMLSTLAANSVIGNITGGAATPTAVATSSLFSGTTGQVDYFSGTGALVGTSTLFISTASKVGVGTTSPLSLFSIGTAGNAFRVDATGAVKEGIWNGSAIPVANGGTGDTGTAWTTYAPAITCTTGTFTSISAAVAKYKTIGKTTFIHIEISDVTNGSCTGNLEVTLPNTPSGVAIGYGNEQAITGKALKWYTSSNNNKTFVQYYDNSSPLATGGYYNLAGVYEAQ